MRPTWSERVALPRATLLLTPLGGRQVGVVQVVDSLNRPHISPLVPRHRRHLAYLSTDAATAVIASLKYCSQNHHPADHATKNDEYDHSLHSTTYLGRGIVPG